MGCVSRYHGSISDHRWGNMSCEVRFSWHGWTTILELYNESFVCHFYISWKHYIRFVAILYFYIRHCMKHNLDQACQLNGYMSSHKAESYIHIFPELRHWIRTFNTCRDDCRDRFPGWLGNVPGIPGAYATRYFTYLVSVPFWLKRLIW